MYDKKWERFSLGKVSHSLSSLRYNTDEVVARKISAFRETSLAYEIHQAGASKMSYLYMGTSAINLAAELEDDQSRFG